MMIRQRMQNLKATMPFLSAMNAQSLQSLQTLPPSRNNSDITSNNEIKKTGIRSHPNKYLFAAFIVAVITVAISGLLFSESDNDQRSHLWRAFATSIAWSFNTVGGAILTSLCFSLLLPEKLQDCLKDIQNATFG